MAQYTVKVCPIRKGGAIIPVGGTIELADNETAGIEQFLELSASQTAPKGANVADTVVLVQAAQTIEELDKLAEGETRKGVNDAIAKRRTELAG